ncbi:hypothetical protein [Ramlibacter rhizophilus]|uniref:hypothetical protein n=1 Tax=Ramlibacter rhizophilus TaxID=1781167 RepID=UPI0014323023|nr:hypothetical protein [Ramlibacter rhizophilus]
MATHPVEPDPDQPGGDESPEPANPTRLPVEPEFQPDWKPVEPEAPGAPKAHEVRT